MLAAVLVVCIYRLGEEYSVENVEAADVARTNTEYSEVFSFFSRVDYINFLVVDFKLNKVFCLREEEIASRFL